MDETAIEFPCRYPIRVIGEEAAELSRDVLQIVRGHSPEVTPDDVNVRHSRHGKYVSIRVTILATGEPQLRALHADLMALPEVRMVL